MENKIQFDWRVPIKEQKEEEIMKTHNYPLRIQDEVWNDLKRIQELDKRSANSLINEGVRMVIADKLQKISQQQKQRNSLEGMTA